MMRQTASTLKIVFIPLVVALFLSQPVFAGEKPDKQSEIRIGQTAYSFALPKLNGEYFFSKDYCKPRKNASKDSDKTLIIEFFSVDCKACRAQIKTLQRFKAQHPDADFDVILISIDSSPETVLPEFIKECSIEYPVLIDKYQKVLKRYGFSTVPKTIVLASGCKVAGIIKQEDELKEVLDRLFNISQN